MSEVPTEEDKDKCGFVIGFNIRHGVIALGWPGSDKDTVAWMPVPKFHGWPDPLADLLKMHGVAVTPELAAALNTWKITD